MINEKNKTLGRSSIFIAISILLHAIIFLLAQLDKDFFIPKPDDKPSETEKRLVFELIESSEEEIPTTETNLLSDKNSTAKDDNYKKSVEDLPSQKGDLAIKSLTKQFQKSLNKKEENKPKAKAEKSNEPNFFEDFQARKSQSTKQEELTFNQILNSAKENGGISFNTYEWEFAPYMLELKRKVQKNIHPPYAFTHLGLIDGNTLVRFKIYPDGSLQDLKIIGSDAHQSLDVTSENAIKFSAPFAPLPKNFPEPYLEVTALFAYLIKK